MTTQFADTKVLITGAASGIGRATARAFAREGARLLAVDLPDSQLAEQYQAPEFSTVHIAAMDVAQASSAEQLVQLASEQLGGLDILVNNAGIGNATAAEDTSDEVWQRVLEVNLSAPFRLCRAAIPLLRQSPAGRIINIASVMAQYTDYGLSAYCASKAGVAGLTKTLALELGKDGITSNYIMPGAIHTGMTAQSFADPKIADIWARKSVLRRLGQPEDVAAAILFFASPQAAFVTGEGLEVSGGLNLRT